MVFPMILNKEAFDIFAEQAFIVEKFTFAGNDILLDEQFNTEILNVPLLFRTDVDTVMVFPIILNKEAFDIFAVELFKLDTLTVVVFIVVGLNVDVVNVDTVNDDMETLLKDAFSTVNLLVLMFIVARLSPFEF